MKHFLSILKRLPTYKKEYVSGDLSAGITTGVMLIPQGMAYATLAGLPPHYGLYTAIFPQIVYAILGTSRQLAVGPVAMDSLIVAAGLSTIANAHTADYISMAIVLAFLMGIFQLIFGLAKLGFLANFLSKPVISGITSGAALVVGIGQLKNFLKIEIPSGSISTLKTISILVQNIEDTHLITFVIGILSFIIILLIKKINQLIPAALIILVVTTYTTMHFQLNNVGVNIIGFIPGGLPSFSLPNIDFSKLPDLITLALSLAFVGYLEAISVAKVINHKYKERSKIKTNHELVALGSANFISSFFSCYPATGGFSRSAINAQLGAKSKMAALISASVVVITLLWLTPLFHYLPKAVLASIILVGVISLFDYKYPIYLWKTHKEDFAMLFISFIATILFGIKEGILTGIACSVVYLILLSTRPHFAIVGKLPHSNEFRNIKRFKEAAIRKDILVYRFFTPIYFANINFYMSTLRRKINQKGIKLKLVIMQMDAVNYIDSTSLLTIEELINELNIKGIKVHLCGVTGPVRDFFHKTNFMQELGEENFFLEPNTAIKYFDETADQDMVIHFKNAIQTNVFGKDKL